MTQNCRSQKAKIFATYIKRLTYSKCKSLHTSVIKNDKKYAKDNLFIENVFQANGKIICTSSGMALIKL